MTDNISTNDKKCFNCDLPLAGPCTKSSSIRICVKLINDSAVWFELIGCRCNRLLYSTHIRSSYVLYSYLHHSFIKVSIVLCMRIRDMLLPFHRWINLAADIICCDFDGECQMQNEKKKLIANFVVAESKFDS